MQNKFCIRKIYNVFNMFRCPAVKATFPMHSPSAINTRMSIIFDPAELAESLAGGVIADAASGYLEPGHDRSYHHRSARFRAGQAPHAQPARAADTQSAPLASFQAQNRQGSGE
jgi:hypothetical protein